jgi:hypothetical protein
MQKLFTICLIFLYISAKAQDTPSDTIQVITNPTVAADSTASEEAEEEEGDEEGEEEEVEKDKSFSKFKYRMGADGTYTSGNVSRILMQFTSSFDLTLSKVFKLATSPSYIYGQQNGLLAENEFFVDLRTNLFYEKRFYYLAFTSFEKSNLRKIENRFIGGAGVGYRLIKKERTTLSVTNVLLYEKTDFILNEKFPDRNLWRNSTRISGEYSFNDSKFSLSHILFIQPIITENNFRWNGNLILKYQLSKQLSLRTTMENSYESIVVPGRANNDFRWTFGIVFEGKK